MRNEHDGEDISYMKCLRCLADKQRGRAASEEVGVLATVELGEQGLKIDYDGEAISLEKCCTVGFKVDLEQRLLFLRTGTASYGPYRLVGAAAKSPLRLVVEARQATICWSSFELPAPSAQLQDVQCESLRSSLEALMERAGVEGDLSLLKNEARRAWVAHVSRVSTPCSGQVLERMGLEVVVRCLDEAQQRTLGAAMAQLRGLKGLAQVRSQELTRKQRLGL